MDGVQFVKAALAGRNLLAKGEWNEDDHPRGEDGKFSAEAALTRKQEQYHMERAAHYDKQAISAAHENRSHEAMNNRDANLLHSRAYKAFAAATRHYDAGRGVAGEMMQTHGERIAEEAILHTTGKKLK